MTEREVTAKREAWLVDQGRAEVQAEYDAFRAAVAEVLLEMRTHGTGVTIYYAAKLRDAIGDLP